jgi:flagellar biosynthesis chaperone FliJ
MQSFELTQPVSSAILLKQFESRFGQTMNLQGLDKAQLEDLANSVRTKIHTITDNLHFGKELKDNEYQKSQMMLDILNQAINEYGGGMASSIIGKATGEIKDKLSKGQAVSPADRKAAAQAMKTEGVEEQSELILAAKDMMDKVTGYLEDLASMKTEGMLELADRIRDEMGADKADAFLQKIQPAIEQAESTLTQTRQDLDQGVRILTGEETATDTIGADTMNTDADLDSLESPEEDDEFGATDAEAGGTEPEGREQRESKEVFEQSNRIYAKLAGK